MESKNHKGENSPWRSCTCVGEGFFLVFCRRYSIKITHNRIKITNPPIPPTVAPIVVIRLERELIAEGVVVVIIDGVAKGGGGRFGVSSGGKGNVSVKSVVEELAIGEYANPTDEAGEDGDGGLFRASSGGWGIASAVSVTISLGRFIAEKSTDPADEAGEKVSTTRSSEGFAFCGSANSVDIIGA